MVGPIKSGKQAMELVAQMLAQFGVEMVSVDFDLATRAAGVRAQTDLKLPDAFALATVIHAEHRGHEDVELATFDRDVLKAHVELHPG